MKEFVVVSPEMTVFVGRGMVPPAPLPDDALVLSFSGFDSAERPLLELRDEANFDALCDAAVVLVVTREACLRLFPKWALATGAWHLTSALREGALSIFACEANSEARTTLQLARSIELFCQAAAALAADTLVPAAGDGTLCELDQARIAAARRMLDEGWREKLTIADLARGAGINRDKLVRGFRSAYGSTIAEALSERRLAEARSMLLSSDLPVSCVGYNCGYLNNASFTRAFSRRFGVVPSELRRLGVAA